LMPGGQFSGRAPQRCVTERPIALATHTLSSPSMAMPQGPLMLLVHRRGGSRRRPTCHTQRVPCRN
jgi:hypothetical protein